MKKLALVLFLLLSPPAQAVDLGGLLLEVAGVEDVKIGTGGTEAVVVLSLERTRWPPLVLRDATLDIMVSGKPIGQAVVREKARLRRDRPQEVRLDCTLSALSGLSAVLGGLSKGELSFRLKGEVSGRVFWIIPRTYAIKTPLIEL